MSNYLLLGSESALADRAMGKLMAQFKEASAEITTIFSADAIVGDIADALSPSLFSEKRVLIIRDLQDLLMEVQDEVTRYLDDMDPTITVVFIHKGGVKGKALLDTIKKTKPEIITCEPLKKESEKQDFVKNMMLDLGRKITPSAVAALVSAVGNELRELSAACSQIASDTTGVIDESMIDKYIKAALKRQVSMSLMRPLKEIQLKRSWHFAAPLLQAPIRLW